MKSRILALSIVILLALVNIACIPELEILADNMARESSKWREEMTKVIEDLRAKGKTEYADLLNQFMQRTIGTAGVESKCSADFVRSRLVEGIIEISRHKRLPSPKPSVCSTNPTVINMANRPLQLEFYGYDFDAQDKGGVQAFLTSNYGTEQLSQWTQRSSPYLMTVTVAQSSDIPLCNKQNRRIVLRWGAKELSSVAITPAPCDQINPALAVDVLNPPVTDEQGRSWPNCIGTSDTEDYGRKCTEGYIRYDQRLTKINGKGWAKSYWIDSKNQTDCRVTVRYGTRGCDSVKYRLEIREVPKPKPCDCR